MENKNTTPQEPDSRPRLRFIRSCLFFWAGGLFAALITAIFALQMLTGRDYTLWCFFPVLLAGCVLMVFYARRHPDITAADRMLMNVWMYALLICIYTGIWQYTNAGLPVMGFLTVGASIAAGVTSEIYRLHGANNSEIRGSLVGLGWIATAGAFLSANIFIAAHDGTAVGQFALTLGTITILFFGTGTVLRYNERRDHV